MTSILTVDSQTKSNYSWLTFDQSNLVCQIKGFTKILNLYQKPHRAAKARLFELKKISLKNKKYSKFCFVQRV